MEDPCAAARFAVGSADRLLAVYLVQFVRLAVKRLVGKSLQLRKKYAGLLLNTLKLLLIAATKFSDFSEKPHNREFKYAHYFVSCINFA